MAEWFARIAPHLQERLERFGDVPGMVDFLFLPEGEDVAVDEASWAKAFGPEWAQPLLADVAAATNGAAVDFDLLADLLRARDRLAAVDAIERRVTARGRDGPVTV